MKFIKIAVGVGLPLAFVVATAMPVKGDFDLQGLNQQVQRHEEQLQNHEARLSNTEADVQVIQVETGVAPAPNRQAAPSVTTDAPEPTQPAPQPEPTPEPEPQPDVILETCFQGGRQVPCSSP